MLASPFPASRTSESKRARSNGLRLSPSSASGARRPTCLTFADVSWPRQAGCGTGHAAVEPSNACLESRSFERPPDHPDSQWLRAVWRRRQIRSVARRTVTLGGPGSHRHAWARTARPISRTRRRTAPRRARRVDERRPEFQAAQRACRRPEAELAQVKPRRSIAAQLGEAECMCGHAVSDFPDLLPGGGFTVPSTINP